MTKNFISLLLNNKHNKQMKLCFINDFLSDDSVFYSCESIELIDLTQ